MALPYEAELKEKMRATWYDEKYKFYHNSWHDDINLKMDDWHKLSFVSVDSDDKVIGFINFEVDRITNSVCNVSIINFTNDKTIFGLDLHRAFNDMFIKFNFNKINFSVVCGNPIESSYDRAVKRYGGRIVGYHKAHTRLIDNKLYDTKHYEIMREDYIREFLGQNTSKFLNERGGIYEG